MSGRGGACHTLNSHLYIRNWNTSKKLKFYDKKLTAGGQRRKNSNEMLTGSWRWLLACYFIWPYGPFGLRTAANLLLIVGDNSNDKIIGTYCNFTIKACFYLDI